MLSLNLAYRIKLLASPIGCGLALGLTSKICTLYGDFAVHAA